MYKHADNRDLLRNLDRGMALPAKWYTEPAILDIEIEHVFRRTWQYVACTQEVDNVGDFVTSYVGNVPVVVVRNQSGVAAFINVCRHRRHEVMKGCGNSKVMQCRYHAWTYDLQGQLQAAPRSDREADFNIGEYPLVALKVDSIGPFLFVNFDSGAKPIDSYFENVLNQIASAGIDVDNLSLYSKTEWATDANWKSLLENFLECYHCQIAHPGFSAAIDVDQDNYQLKTEDWHSVQIGEVRASAIEGTAKIKAYDPRGSVTQAQYHYLWPNLTISINPGFPNLSIDVWNPDGPNHSKGYSSQFFAPGVDEKWAKELVEFNQQVGREDDELTSSVQRGLIGGIPSEGRLLLNSEKLILHFQKLLLRELSSALGSNDSDLR